MDVDSKLNALEKNLKQVIKGKDEAVRLSIVALIARGHLLIEDVPGVGKTTLAHALARSIDGSFHRIQFTSDLLPSDIIGVTIYNQKKNSFEFKKGPLFTHVLLADEINRATPKTQSALLEAMNDSQVTVDRKTHPLPKPFFVVATQNPIEYEGTYPLPESQLDRFMVCLDMGYPSKEDERKIIVSSNEDLMPSNLHHVLDTNEVLKLQERVENVKIENSLVTYLLNIIEATRNSPEVLELGVSPRGGIALRKAAQAFALIQGRDYVVPDDIKNLSPYLLAHRVILNTGGEFNVMEERRVIIRDLLEKVEVPL